MLHPSSRPVSRSIWFYYLERETDCGIKPRVFNTYINICIMPDSHRVRSNAVCPICPINQLLILKVKFHFCSQVQTCLSSNFGVWSWLFYHIWEFINCYKKLCLKLFIVVLKDQINHSTRLRSWSLRDPLPQ